MDVRPNHRTIAFGVAGLMVGGVLANLAQLPAMENNETLSYRAFVRADSGSMAAIGLEESPTVREGRGIYLWLSELAPGVTLFLGRGTALEEWQLFGFADVGAIIDLDVESDGLLADLDVREYVVADDDDGRFGPVPFTIALADEEPDALVVRVVGDRHDLIDVRLLPADLREELTT